MIKNETQSAERVKRAWNSVGSIRQKNSRISIPQLQSYKSFFWIELNSDRKFNCWAAFPLPSIILMNCEVRNVLLSECLNSFAHHTTDSNKYFKHRNCKGANILLPKILHNINNIVISEWFARIRFRPHSNVANAIFFQN